MTSHAEQERALARAAAPALAAIEEDGSRAPDWLRPLFVKMRELIFVPDLKLEQIQKAAGLADIDVPPAVAEDLRQSAWSCLRDGRLETAAHLLLETEKSVAEIGYLVGYGSAPSFRNLLRDFLGMPPAQYRRRASRILERAGPLPEGAQTNAYWEKLLAGELSGDQARAIDAYLERLMPASTPAAAASEDDERTARLRQTLAEGLAAALDNPMTDDRLLSFAEQRQLVRDAVWFPDGTFFEHLSELSRAADDPERGVELAQLALDSLATNRLLEPHPGRQALAWARLARARWRAGDPGGAERDLARSAGDTERSAGDTERSDRGAERSDRGAADAGDIPVSWEAEHNQVAAACLWLRGRRRQALALAERSVAGYRAAGGEALGGALVLRAELRAAGAELDTGGAGARVAELRRALSDLEEARGVAVSEAAPLPQASVSLWLRLLALLGSGAEIAAALPAVRQAAKAMGPGSVPRVLWLKGHSAGDHDAETLWRDARERFSDLGDDLWSARATLDLARRCLAGERPGEAAALASELASILGTLTAGAEDLAALKPLGRAAPFTAVTAGDLDGAEAVLKRLEWARRAQRALELAG